MKRSPAVVTLMSHKTQKQPKQLKRSSSDLVAKKLEDGFKLGGTAFLSKGIPVYNAETDPYCPRAQVKKYNNERRIAAEEAASKAKRSDVWIKKTLQSKFDEVPSKFNPAPTLRVKATGAATSGPESLAEIEILQKVIVRENLLGELQKLLHNQNDVTGCLSEVVELVKAIRYQTVDIIEDIDSWQYTQPSPRPFLYRGVNYLIKIFSDLNFLDQYADIVEKFCFEFTSNPLAYRGGGDIATGLGGNARSTLVDKLSQSYNASGGSFDGIEIIRLRNAERTIQREFDRLDRGRQLFGHQSQQMLMAAASIEAGTVGVGDGASMAIGEAAFGGSVAQGGSVSSPYVGLMQQYGGGSVDIASQDYYRDPATLEQMPTNNARKSIVPKSEGKRKWRQKFSNRKVKFERIATLTEEASELKAMSTHIEDKTNTLVEQHRVLVDKRKIAEGRRKEAMALDREAAAQHFAVEISVFTADMQDINARIKDFQRQNYFISIERNRKRKVAAKLKDEIEIEKRRSALEEKLAEKIKEGGILNALKTLNQMQTKQLNKDLGMENSADSLGGGTLESNSLLEFIQQQEDELKRSPQAQLAQQALPEVKFGGMEAEPSYAVGRNIHYQDESLEGDSDVEYLEGFGDGQRTYEEVGDGYIDIEEEDEDEDQAVAGDFDEDPEYRIDTQESWRGPSPRGAGALDDGESLGDPASFEDMVRDPATSMVPSYADSRQQEVPSIEPPPPDLKELEAGEEVVDAESENFADVVIPTGNRLDVAYLSSTIQESGEILPAGNAMTAAKILRREGKGKLADMNDEQEQETKKEPTAPLSSTTLEQFSAHSESDQALIFAELESSLVATHDLFVTGDYLGAKRSLDSLLKARRRLALPTSHVTVGARLLVAEWHRSQGNYAHAKEMYDKCLGVVRDAADEGKVPDTPECISTLPTLHLLLLVGLADWFRNMARYEECETTLRDGQCLVALPADGFVGSSVPGLGGHAAAQAHTLAVAEFYTAQGALSLAKGVYLEAEGYHGEALALREKVLGRKHFKCGSSWTHLGRLAFLQCDYPTAFSCLEKGLEFKAALPIEHPSVAASLYWKASALCAMAQYQASSEAMSQCLSARLAILGETHAACAQAFWGSAEITRLIGYPQHAEENYNKALKIRQFCYPADKDAVQESDGDIEKPSEIAGAIRWHPCMIDSILSAGTNAYFKGNYQEAVPLLEQALAMRQDFYGALGIERHPDIAVAQMLLAQVLIQLNKFEHVKVLLASAGRTLRQTFGRPHSLLANAIHLLGLYHSQMGKFTVAHYILGKALDMHRTIHGYMSQSNDGPAATGDFKDILDGQSQQGLHVVHPEYALCLTTIADNMSGPGCFRDSLAAAEASVMILQQTLGDGIATAAPSAVAVRALFAMGRLKEAEVRCRTILSALRESLGETAPYALVLGDLGEILRAQGSDNLEDASAELASSLHLRRVTLGATHRSVAESLRNIALVSLDQGRAEEAASLMRDGALPMFETVLGAEHPDPMWTSGNVGVCMFATLPQHLESGGDHEEMASMSAAAGTLVKSALDYFHSYEYGVYSSKHPWVLRLGGYPSELSTDDRVDTTESVLVRALRPTDIESLEEWVG